MSVATDIATVKKYTDPGIANQARRVGSFLASDTPYRRNGDTVAVTLLTHSAEGIIGGTLAGAAIGAAVGLLFLQPAPFAKAGAALGSVIEGAVTIRQEVIYFKRSKIYDQWKEKATAEKVYPVFQKYLRDQQLTPFLCPLSGNLIQNPVKDPHGCVYEAAEVQARFEAAAPGPDGIRRIPCFQNRKSGVEGDPDAQLLSERDYTFDLDYHKRLMTALMPHFLKAAIDPKVFAGLKAVREGMIEDRTHMLQSSMEATFKRAISGETTIEATQRQLGSLIERFKII